MVKTIKEFIAKLKKNKGKRFEIKVALNGGVFSRHLFCYDCPGEIYHRSFVDESCETLTIKKLSKGFFERAFRKKAVLSIELAG
ncbi:MAG: hypothetical protein WC976_05985 [Caldisericia bacterium]